MVEILKENLLRKSLENIHGWEISSDDKSIMREMMFKDFIDCFSFMTKIALFAEKVNHHPDWSNCYNKLKITLSTHDSGGVTQKDIMMAVQINYLLSERG